MSRTVAPEGRRIIKILSGFPEFRRIAKVPAKKLNVAINGAVRQLASRTDRKAREAVGKIKALHEDKVLREAEERGCFIGSNPFCD